MTHFTVSVGNVEGPLDLILSLIEERKMLVSDVSLAHIAEDFIAYIKARDTFPAGEAAHFILIASTLLLIKSRTLLPVLTLTEEEEGNIDDLERRLTLYKIFKEAARGLMALDGRLYFSGMVHTKTPVFAPGPDMTLTALHQAACEVLLKAPQEEKKKEVSVQSVISLEDMMGRLATRIERALSVTFSEFVGSPEDRREIVVGFLAVLELVKRGMLSVEQQDRFSDITMHYAGDVQSPRYD